MNIAKYFVLFCIVASGHADEDWVDFTDMVMEIQEYCQDRENVTLEFDVSSEEDEINHSDNYEWKCMLECVASELGVVSFFLKKIN